jgi:tetrahydromethanopterin S-methyltransferase subunit E
MSRKTIMLILGIVGSVGSVIAREFGLAFDPASVIGAVVVALVYIFGEMKVDQQRLRAQAHKWGDPKFISAIILSLLAQVNSAFGLNLPIELIMGILTILLGILFKKDHTQELNSV